MQKGEILESLGDCFGIQPRIMGDWQLRLNVKSLDNESIAVLHEIMLTNTVEVNRSGTGLVIIITLKK